MDKLSVPTRRHTFKHSGNSLVYIFCCSTVYLLFWNLVQLSCLPILSPSSLHFLLHQATSKAKFWVALLSQHSNRATDVKIKTLNNCQLPVLSLSYNGPCKHFVNFPSCQNIRKGSSKYLHMDRCTCLSEVWRNVMESKVGKDSHPGNVRVTVLDAQWNWFKNFPVNHMFHLC